MLTHVLSIMGPVRPGLESARSHLPAPSRLPLLHLLPQGQQTHSDAHHLLPVSMRPRAGHVVSLQEAAGISAGSADVSIACE